MKRFENLETRLRESLTIGIKTIIYRLGVVRDATLAVVLYIPYTESHDYDQRICTLKECYRTIRSVTQPPRLFRK